MYLKYSSLIMGSRPKFMKTFIQVDFPSSLSRGNRLKKYFYWVSKCEKEVNIVHVLALQYEIVEIDYNDDDANDDDDDDYDDGGDNDGDDDHDDHVDVRWWEMVAGEHMGT